MPASEPALENAETGLDLDFESCGLPPEQIRVWKDRTGLTLSWDDGATAEIGAFALRLNCQSAGEKKLRLVGMNVPPDKAISITDLRVLGTYALNIHFSDGYQRGIYPWDFLRQLSAETDIQAGPETVRAAQCNNLTDAGHRQV